MMFIFDASYVLVCFEVLSYDSKINLIVDFSFTLISPGLAVAFKNNQLGRFTFVPAFGA